MLAEHLFIRAATGADAPACAAIYGPYVRDTCISFEIDAPTPEEMARRIASAVNRHAWLVLEGAGRVVGFAYGNQFKERAAYRWSCETSIYLEVDRRRTSGGRALYEALLDRLTERGCRRVFAGMTLPNDANAGIHRALGFEPVGVYRQVGWKHDAWHDVAWMQKANGENDQPPLEPL
jgi:L-amino acid N-acyltransferase YncA